MGAETQGKVIAGSAADEISSFFPQRSFCCQESSPWSWETPGPSVQPFRDLISIVGLCFVWHFFPELPFFAGTSAWRSAETKVLTLKREANPCQEQGWVGTDRDKEDTFFTHLVCTLVLPSFLRPCLGLWHPEELECTFYFQYFSPQEFRNHKPSPSKLQDWVKSHETAVKITFQGSFSLPSVFRDLCLCPACFRIFLQQKKVEMYNFSVCVRQSYGENKYEILRKIMLLQGMLWWLANYLFFAQHEEWDGSNLKYSMIL